MPLAFGAVRPAVGDAREGVTTDDGSPGDDRMVWLSAQTCCDNLRGGLFDRGIAVELNQIRYFVELARTLHFTKAAEACNVSQPALTKAIQKLEEELGGPLLHRERGATQLTDLGRGVLPALEQALAAARDAKLAAESFRKRQSSPLRIGLEYSVPAAVLTPVLTALRRQTPDVELLLHAGSSSDIAQRMLQSQLDVALLVDGPEVHERLHRWEMFAERYVLLCAPDHPFRDREAVAATDLAEQPLLLHEEADCPVRRFLEDVWGMTGVRPRRLHFASSQEQILEMVGASLAVSVAGERLPSAAGLVRRPIVAEPDSRRILLAVVAGRPLGPTPSLFLKLMRARCWTGETANSGAALAVAA